MDLDRVDPALRKATARLPSTDPSRSWMRLAARAATRLMPVPRVDGVTVSMSRGDGVHVRVYTPRAIRSDAALFWIHGGGLLFGDAKQDERLCAGTAAELGIRVVSANYRFAPEHPFPAAADDVRAGWEWLVRTAPELGIDPGRIAIGGESAGGGLAAALVQRLHDETGVQPVAQWLFAPMIDDRTAADETLDAVGHLVWDNRANRVGWTAYLGRSPGAATIPAYSAAARREDLAGLPPAFITVSDIELFFAEDVDYATRLRAAGVPVLLDIVPGAPHGFSNWAHATEPARALLTRARGWLSETLGA